MASWDTETASPELKFEASPAESFLSMPGEMYPPLFGSSAPSTTMNPQEIMSPSSFADEKSAEMSVLTGLSGVARSSSPAPASANGDKKPVKKRKSWGQVLPEPKTNLPPRKRAKTEDEKEQRRVERVLRNRRAAQSSRERKRLEVEALEERNQELEALLLKTQNDNLVLFQELSKLRGNSGVVTRNPITFSQELFSSQDGHSRLMEQKPSLGSLMMTSQSQTTINPTTLSPALSPVSNDGEDDDELAGITAAEISSTVKPSPDLTQQPAVSVGGSFSVLDGLPAATVADSVTLLAANPLSDVHFNAAYDLQAAIDADSYVLESRLLSSPNSNDSEYDCVVGDQTFPFTSTDFDINDFLHDETNQPSGGNVVNGLAAEPGHHDPETQTSSEDPNLQPHVGASSFGCDDGGIAVGTF